MRKNVKKPARLHLSPQLSAPSGRPSPQTPIEISNVRMVQSSDDSAKSNSKSQMHVVRSLTFQHHADDNVDDENKSLTNILHIPEKNKVIAFS